MAKEGKLNEKREKILTDKTIDVKYDNVKFIFRAVLKFEVKSKNLISRLPK